MELLEAMEQRHSVRQYTNAAIEQEKRSVLDALAAQINKENDLNIQVIYDEPECFNSFMAHYGKFSGVNSYIALVGKKSPALEEKLGYFGEKLTLTAQQLGLNTCWVAMTHGKSRAKIGKGEKQVCIIALGYGAVQGAAHKNKPLNEVCNYTNGMPQWFIDGINAALLAPTAMNQQKFFFELKPDGTVKGSYGKGFYTKLDYGIAKFHFEAAAGKTVE